VFGGGTGPLRLLNAALGGQAGWLLGLALVGAVAVLAASRARRRDPRTAWLLVIGGSFLVTAGLFSFARGILHPYYVVALAPFTAALVGAGVATVVRADVPVAAAGAATLAAGVICEFVVLHNYGGQLCRPRAARRRSRWSPSATARACGRRRWHSARPRCSSHPPSGRSTRSAMPRLRPSRRAVRPWIAWCSAAAAGSGADPASGRRRAASSRGRAAALRRCSVVSRVAEQPAALAERGASAKTRSPAAGCSAGCSAAHSPGARR
jgi:hypothetical protein